MKRLRTALIGCGKVGGIHARALQLLQESEFVAACDSSSERAGAFADAYGTAAFTNITSMVRESGAEMVCLCTPHPLHAEGAIEAMEAGAHVLVEKPLAATLRDCDLMISAAESNNVQLGVVSQRRFFEPVQRIRAALDAGKLGVPILGTFLMLSWRDKEYYASDPWRGRWDSEGGGVLVNQAPHQLDLLQWFMGPIDEISGYWANLNHRYIEVEDTALAMIRFRNGGLGSIVASLSQRPGVYTKVHIHGSNGASAGVQTDSGATFVAGMTGIAAPPVNDLWTISGEEHLLEEFEATDRAQFASGRSTDYYHERQIQDFLQAMLNGRKPSVTAAEGRTVVEMFTAIYRSNRERVPVQFPVAT